MSWPNDTHSNTLPEYLFELRSNLGNKELKDYPPLEWRSAKLTFERLLDKGGVFSTFNVGSLTFVNDGAKLIKDNFEANEINAECEMFVYWLNQDTQSYESFPTSFELNFKTYKIVKIDNFGIGVNIEVSKNGILEKLNNRSDIDVDITKTESIGGYSIIDYADLKRWVKMPQIKSELKGNYDESNGIRFNVSQTTLALLNISSSDFEGDLVLVNDGLTASKNNSFLFESSRSRELNINGSVDVIYSSRSLTNTSTAKLRIQIYDTDGNQISDNILGSKTLDPTQSQTEITFNTDFTLSLGYSMSCTIGFSSISDVDDEFEWDNIDFNLKDTVLSVESTNIECVPVYPACERNLQLILDKQYPFISNFFGGVDDIYNSNGDKYLSENQLRFAVYTSGIGIRGENLAAANNPLNFNFQDNFKTLQSVYNIGYGVEIIDSESRIRFEAYSYFFQDTEILDFSDQLTRLDIETEVMPELCYVSVISGFENYDYESVNGRGEYNTKNKRTTILNADAEFSNVAPYRADTQGFVDLLKQNININDSTDAKGDNDTFFLKVQKNTLNPAIDWDAEQEENIFVLDNTSPYNIGGLNLYTLPTRMLNRNSNRWACGLQKQTSSKVRFQTAGKNQVLKSDGNPQSGQDEYIITENDNLQIGDVYALQTPLYRPIKHTVSVVLTFEQIKLIQANPYGLIKISTNISGWILKLEKQNDEDKAIVTIIEKYTS